MAINTWVGGESGHETDWNRDANWNTTGVTNRIPTSADDVIIPDTSSLHNPTLSATGGNPKNVKSLTIQTNGTIVGGGIQIRVYGQNASGFAVDNDGIIDGGSTLNLEIKTPSATDIDLAGTSGNFNNLKINDASCVATMKSDCILNGDLDIAAGQLTTGVGGYGYSNLTVTKKTTIGPDSGAADQATLTCGSSTLSLGSGKTDGLGLHVRQGGTFVGGSGTHTMGSLGVDNNAAAKYTNTSDVNTLNGHSNDSTRVIIGGSLATCTAAGTITITYAGGGYNLQSGNAAMINNLTLNSNVTANLSADTSITGNLTITQGTLTTTGSDFALTVTEDMLVQAGGTFTGNSSAVIMRSLELQGAATFSAPNASGSCTINGRKNGTSRCIDVGNNDNNFSGNGGTLTFTSANGGDLQGLEHLSAADELNNLTINVSDGSGTFYLMGDTTVTGNLTITAGTLTTNNGSADKDLTVTGAIDCAGNLTCNSSAVQCNGLRSTGGTVNLPDGSGSFTVKGTEFSGYGIHDTSGSGNLVHNGGTVIWDIGGLSTMQAKSTFNNITTATSSTDLRWFGTLTLAGVLTVAANTDVYEHASAGGNLTVGGAVTVSGKLGDSSAYSAYEFKSLTISSGGTYIATSGTTIITGEGDGTGGSTNGVNLLNDSGTFTHNKGTVKVTCATQTSLTGFSGTNGFYNYTYAGTGTNEDQVLGGNTDFFGQVIVDSASSALQAEGHTFNYYGPVIIKQGTWEIGSTTQNCYSGVRNIGGSVDTA